MPEWLIIVLVVIAGIVLLILFGSEHLSPYARGRSRTAGRNPAMPSDPQLSDRYDPVRLQQQEALESTQNASGHKS